MYGVSTATPALFSIDTSTAISTLINPSNTSLLGAVFDAASSTLYSTTDDQANHLRSLATVDTSTALATPSAQINTRYQDFIYLP